MENWEKLDTPPCPFCKSDNTELVFNRMTARMYVACCDCNAMGPDVFLEGEYSVTAYAEKAIRMWERGKRRLIKK